MRLDRGDPRMHKLRMAAGVQLDECRPPVRDLRAGTAPCDQKFGDLIARKRRNRQRSGSWQSECEQQPLRKRNCRSDQQMAAALAQNGLNLHKRHLQRTGVRRYLDVIEHDMREPILRAELHDDAL